MGGLEVHHLHPRARGLLRPRKRHLGPASPQEPQGGGRTRLGTKEYRDQNQIPLLCEGRNGKTATHAERGPAQARPTIRVQ